jgi:Kef-type K+ transport system membrane component KefB
MTLPTDDPVVAKRDRIDRLNKIASRTGYGLYAVSTITFFAGLWTDYTGVFHFLSGASLIIGSVILAPSIVITYGIRAARREDAKAAAEQGSGKTETQQTHAGST